MPAPNTVERICSRVIEDGGCWIMPTGAFVPGGYRRVGFRGRKVLAHRWAWEQSNGPVPEGMFVCHRCDNPPCIRPEHLFIGTRADNIADMVAKGRARNHKLNHPEYVYPRRTHCRNGHPFDALPRTHNGGCRLCYRIRDREWKREQRRRGAAA